MLLALQIAQTQIENNAIHAGVVLGPETKLPKDKIETDLKLIYDNEIIDTWNNKMWPVDMLSELNWLVKEQAKNNNHLFLDNYYF